MRQVEEKVGVWQIEARERLLGAMFSPLPDAVPDLPGGLPAEGVFGIVSGRLLSPRPAGGGTYVVRLVSQDASDGFYVLAYIDLFGRAFSCNAPFEAPPARAPEIEIAHFPEEGGGESNGGYVYVRDSADASARAVAEYRVENHIYSLSNSWYDFADHARGLSYARVMARCFLAFFHRPSLGAPSVPTHGVNRLLSAVRADAPLAGLYDLVDGVHAAQADDLLHAPAIVNLFVENLERAGLMAIRARGVSDSALRMVKSTAYAHVRYLTKADDNADVSQSELWGIEAAMNRLQFIASALGDTASSATMDQCRAADELLFELAATQESTGDMPKGAPVGALGGDWDIRCRIACMIEQLRLPVRVAVEYRYDAPSGRATFFLTTPGQNLMPLGQNADADDQAASIISQAMGLGSGASAGQDPKEYRQVAASLGIADPWCQARSYAMSVGLLVASHTFSLHDVVERVRVVAVPLAEDPAAARPFLNRVMRQAQAAASETEQFTGALEATCASAAAVASVKSVVSAIDDGAAAIYDVEFTRDLWESLAHFSSFRSGNPDAAFLAAGARFDVPAPDLPRDAMLRPVFEAWRSPAGTRELSPDAALTLGARDVRDLDIEYDTVYRSMAEEIAEKLLDAGSASEAIKIVRTFSDEAVAAHDERAVTACARLMSSLAEGVFEPSDQNAVVGRFLGEDRCLVALGRVRAMDMGNPEQAKQAISLLSDAVSETRLFDGISDGAEVVYRYFDSYASRVLYNLSMAGRIDAIPRAAADAGKRVLPAPDSFFLCHMELVHLLERSFTCSEEALRYGRDMLGFAPASALSYRTLGRAYMLMGDMEHARSVLVDGLRVALQPADISLLYYQLAYVLWKAGDAKAGMACYLKSVSVSSAVAVQATAELQELMNETRMRVPNMENLDELLEGAGVPCAPDPTAIDALDEAAACAADAGLAHIARSALAVRVRYRPDDALMDVLASFGG